MVERTPMGLTGEGRCRRQAWLCGWQARDHHESHQLSRCASVAGAGQFIAQGADGRAVLSESLSGLRYQTDVPASRPASKQCVRAGLRRGSECAGNVCTVQKPASVSAVTNRSRQKAGSARETDYRERSVRRLLKAQTHKQTLTATEVFRKTRRTKAEPA